MATLTISIDRTSLSLTPLVLSGSKDGSTWGVLPGFMVPGKVARTRYVSSLWTHGDVATSSTWQHARLAFDVTPSVTSAAALTTAVAQLEAALGQFSYETTVTRNGVASVWDCDMGSLEPSPLDLPELDRNAPVYAVTIPCYPVGA